jgi:hypothetical protein
MGYAFISGIPASGKSYVAKKVADKAGTVHVDLDKLRMEMLKDPKLEPWVSFFWNHDESEYWENTNPEKHWANLNKQSEAMWPFILKHIKGVQEKEKSAIFECVNILPHLAKRDLTFPGVYLLGESMEVILERLAIIPRWGDSALLQKKEAEYFYMHEGKKYKSAAGKYGYKSFSDNKEAEKELLRLLAI